jgi:hypothetical protein
MVLFDTSNSFEIRVREGGSLSLTNSKILNERSTDFSELVRVYPEVSTAGTA